MLTCPNCHKTIVHVESKGGDLWTCAKCGGCAVRLNRLQKEAGAAAVAALSVAARTVDAPRKRRCPICAKPMVFAHVPRRTAPRTVPLDFCSACQLVWCDSTEYAAVAAQPGEGEEPAKYVDAKWKWLPAVLGFPVERETPRVVTRPWVTWTLAALIILITLLTIPEFQVTVRRFGLIPSQFWRHGGLTLFTSFFLHGGLFHLLANVYFLLVFGDNVEDYLGKARYLGLLLLSSLTGDILHALLEPQSQMPVVGASGGISGITVFYGLAFPRARLLVLLTRLAWWPLKIRARTALLLWFLVQLVGAWLQMAGVTHVSALSHLGGAAVGFGFWLRWRMS